MDERTGMEPKRQIGREVGSADAPSALDLDRFLPYRLSVAQLAVSRSLARIYERRFGLSRQAWRTLAVLGQDAPLTANGVCARTNMDKVQVSRAVAGLLSTGLIARRTDREDRRRGFLRLTPRGRSVYRKIVPRVLDRERELLAALSERESRDLARILDKLRARAEALSDQPE